MALDDMIKSLPESQALDKISKDATNRDEDDLAHQMKQKQERTVSLLSKHISDVWTDVEEANRDVRTSMLVSLRRVKGEYDALKLAAIRAFQGSEAYIRSAENKCRAADSWIKDIYRGNEDLPWELEPTAVPDLPDNIKEQIEEQIQKQGEQMLQQLQMEAQQKGTQVDPNDVAVLMQEWQEDAEDKATEALSKEAAERCKRAAKQIRDQNQEGGWNDAFKDFLWYFIRLRMGIIKGPTLTKKSKNVWQVDENNKFAIKTVETLITDVYAVNPFNFYPIKGMSKINDGDLIEVHSLTKDALSKLIGVPGYDQTEVSAVIAELQSGALKSKWFTIQDETAVAQAEKDKNTTSLNDKPLDTVLAQEFWGTVSGTLLIEWGLAEGINPSLQYQVNCWKIGQHVIKAVINPDGLGRKPYHCSSWAKNPNWIWGEGLLDFSAVIEDTLNAITRALINNIAIASGPQVEVNTDRCDTKTPLHPWGRWESTSAQMKEGKAVEFWQPNMHVQELISAWEFFSKVLDEMTVPAYAQGASQSGVTAGTATVFTQLLAAASRSIKAVVANIDDDIISPYIQMCYDFLMKTTTDESLKGDARAVAKGVNGLLAKEQQAQRKVEFLQVAANPAFSQILGAENIGAILAQIAKANDILLPDMDRLEGGSEVEQMFAKIIGAQAGADPNQQTGQIGAGGTPANSQATTSDGRAMGSPDQQQPVASVPQPQAPANNVQENVPLGMPTRKGHMYQG